MDENIAKAISEIKDKLTKEDKNPIKIALFGQPGAGKSSIINKIVGKKIAKEGAGTDITQEAQIIKYKDLIFVDLPGFGTSKFPQNEYLDKFDISDYDLFLNVFSDKFHKADTDFFSEIREKGKVSLLVRNKSDMIWDIEEIKSKEELCDIIQEDARKQVKSYDEKVIFTSAIKNIGFDELNESIYTNIDSSKKERYERSARAYTFDALERKREACKKGIHLKAALSAGNALNPIPGAGVAVDVGILLALFKDIRENFGLDDESLNSKGFSTATLPILNKIIEFSTKEGILLILKQFAGREAVKEVSKYVPFVGTAISASLGFGIIEYAGQSYVDDCYEAAKSILEQELKHKSSS